MAHVAYVRPKADFGGFVHFPVRIGNRHPFHPVVDEPIQLDRRPSQGSSDRCRNIRDDRVIREFSHSAGGAAVCSARRLPLQFRMETGHGNAQL